MRRSSYAPLLFPALAVSAACGLRRRPDAPRRFAWSIDEWIFTRALPGGGRAIGTAPPGRHGDRFFYVAAHSPEEYAGGLGPRAARILAEWRREDAGGPPGGGGR